MIALILIGGVLVIGAAGVAWWALNKGKDTSAAAPAASQSASTPATPNSQLAEPEPASAPQPAGVASASAAAPSEPTGVAGGSTGGAPEVATATPTDQTPDQNSKLEQTRKEEKLRLQREANAKRKAELDARRAADEERRYLATEAERRRDDERSRYEEARRRQAQMQTAPPTDRRSVQQVCGDRNFISRGICEARECAKPERMNSAYCTELRERQTQSNSPGGY